MERVAKILLFAVCVVALATSAIAATKTVTWSLPEGWDSEVSYPEVQGYRAIVGPELSVRSDIGKIADPDLPYYRIRVALPANGTFDAATCEVEWEKVGLGGALPLPIARPVPTGGELVYPRPGESYRSVYPAENAKAEYLQIINDIRMMPIAVTPFRWDGKQRQLYKAKKLTVTATYTVPSSRLRLTTSSASSSKSRLTDFQKMALSMTINPSDATTKTSTGLKLTTSSTRKNLAYFGDDNEADYVIISPPMFVDLWKAFAEFRKTTANGSSHTFCVVDTTSIYSKYDTVDGDDALKIHRYIEELYALSPRNIKYVLLGAAAKKYQYERDKMIPARYVVCGGSLSQIMDMYYGCMDRLPVDVGVEVWDYDGDGAYLGHKNANGSYSQDSNAYIDWGQDLAVFRFPLMKEVCESGVALTAEQTMTNFISKITYLESDDYAHRYSAIYTGSTGFSTSTYGYCRRDEMYGLIVDEREFFDQGLNLFSPEHPSWGSDSEFVPRDHGWEFLTYLRGNRKVLMNNSSYSTCTYNDIYKTSGEFLDTVCHGWARGAVGAVNSSDTFRARGFYTIFDCSVPCDTGMYDYCPGGSYGITNCICVGEAPILAPEGGGLASINNTRYGWSARCSTSYGNGWTGQHSFKLSWLFLRSLTGVTSWLSNQTYEPMNAGDALMWAHNNHGTPYATAAWGLSGAQVTGQGDPLARLSVQYERTWEGKMVEKGESGEEVGIWSTNAANWSIAGKDALQVFDISRSVYLPLTGKGSQTFEISNVDSNYFTTAGFYVQQDAGATLTLKGNGTFKSLRETVITNGNVRWEVAGGAGRYGVTFVGDTRGNIELPGNNKRYFGERFVHVGKILASGGNVVIDTPRNAKFGAGNSLDYEEIEFVAEDENDVTAWNQLRSRNPGIFQTDPEKHLRVVNSKLLLQTHNIGGSGSGNSKIPLIYATNSTIKVQANPVWKEEYFVRPTYLHNSTLIGDYATFAFGPADGTTGYDLHVSGKCAISGDTPIKLNGQLRIHFLGDNAELELANSLCDGTAAGSVSVDGSGTIKISATQAFTGSMEIASGVTLEGAIAKLSTGAIVIKGGATARFSAIPLEAVEELTFEKGATVKLPGETANGIYQVVDSAVTTLMDGGATYYDCSTTPATQIVGDISEGYLLKTANILFWKGVDGTWSKSDSSVWTNASGEATAYSDGVPLCFADGSSSTITVFVGEAASPGFMDFRNRVSGYVFDGANAISVNSLAIGTAVTFIAPLNVANMLKVTTGSALVNDIAAPAVEIANGGSLRVKGSLQLPTTSQPTASQSTARVKSGGTLVLDGSFYANLSLEADAILAVDGKSSLTNKQTSSATLSLPETGTVKIDLSKAEDTDQKFPILVGYNLTKDDLAKFECTTEEGMLVVRDGDLYAAPKSELPPYAATVTGNAKWSELGWKNANNTSFTWNDANRRPNGEVQITADTAVTIDIDVGETIGTLVLKGRGAITFTTSVDDPLTPSSIDDSQHTGTLDWRLSTGTASITAGSDTCIRSGAAGSGLLTVGANKKVTLGEGVTFANRAIDPDGWVRFEGARTDFELAGYAGANYSFVNGSLTGDFTLTNHAIRSRSGDYVKFVGNEANFYARSLVNFDITDGTVEYETNGDATWFGRSATAGTTAATVFNQSGGTFRCLATGTGAGGGLLVGYEGGNAVGEEIHLNLTDGSFEVPNSYFNFGNPTVVTLLNNAHLKAKGYIASMSSGTINLGTNSTDAVVMEVGSLGLNAGAASITMYNGSSIVGFEDGAFIEGGILLYPKSWRSEDVMTIAATNDTTLTLRNLLFSHYTAEGATSPQNGNELVQFNGANYGGTIAVDSGSCLPKTWKLLGGSMSFGGVRLVPGSTITAAPSNNGTVSFVLTDDEYESGMSIELIKTSGWSDGYTSDALKNIFKVKVEENGELVDAAGTLESSSGIVSYIPAGGASEYVYPLTATVDGDKDWRSLTWTDRNGKSYAGDWQNVTAAQLVNKAGSYTVTMDAAISLRSLSTKVSANRTLTIADSGANKLTIQNRFDDSASAGTTKPQFSLAGGFQVSAGKNLQLDCANATEAEHGKLVIGGGCVATVYDGCWNGQVEMADSTSKIQYKQTGSSVYDVVPGSIGPSNPGMTEYYIPMTPSAGVAQFGSDTARAAAGTFYFYSGADITTPRFVTGIGNGTVQTFFQRSNVTITGDQGADSDSPSMVFAGDSGSDTTYYVMGGNFLCENAPIILGKGGSANVTFRSTGSSYKVRGITTCGNDNNSCFTLTYNVVLDLGADGIDIRSSIHDTKPKYHPFNIMGTIRTAQDVDIDVPEGIGIAEAYFEPAADTVMTINAPLYDGYMYSGKFEVTGAGRVDLNGASSLSGTATLTAGTLRLAERGLLNNGQVVFNGGKIEVQLTLEEVRAKVGNTYALYKTADTKDNAEANTTVIVQETGNVVNGTFAKDGDNITFTPSAGGDITGGITKNGNVAWTDIVWRDDTGVCDPSVWESVVGNVILSNKFNSTVTIADTISLAKLRVYNDGALTVEGPFTADTVDDSHSTGTTTIGDQGAFESVKAGKDTVLESSGTGTLTIENGMKATSRVAFDGTIANSGTYVYDYPVTALSSFTDDRRYAGGGTAGETTYSSGTLRIEKGAYDYSGKFAMLTATANIAGDTKVTTPRFVLGDGGNGNSSFTLSGGTFEVTGSVAPTSNQATILLGHWSSTPTMTISGGMFIATNAVTRLGWDGRPTVTVGGGSTNAVMHVKGIKSGADSHNNTATFNLNANGVLELGDSGLQALGSSAAYNFNGGKIVAFANATLKSSTADKMTINNAVTFAAEDGKTLTVDADFAGTGTITCGETGTEGTVLFINGTYAETTITGAFAMRLTTAQQSAGSEAILCKTPDTTDLAKVQVQLTSGEVAPGTVTKKDGNLVWTPPACTMPLRAVAKGTVAWADLEWFDSSTPSNAIPKSYWSLLGEISVDVTIEKDAVLTMPAQTELTGKTVAVNGSGTVVANNIWPSSWGGLTDSAKWQGTVKIVNKTGCDGLNFVYLGNASSTVELDNVVGNFSQESVSASNPCGVTYPYTLKLSGSGLTINNGYSEKGFAFARVMGDGPITFGKTGDPRMRLVFKDVTDYTGTLTVIGNAAVTVGTPTSTIDSGKIVIVDGVVTAGKTWTAPNGVEVTGKLTMTPNEVKPFDCAVTFASGSTLNVAQDEDACESVPLTTDTLTMDVDAVAITFNGVAKKGEWTVAAGYLVKTVELTATSEGVTLDTHHNDKILSVTGAPGGFIVVNTAISPVSFATKGAESVLLKYSDSGSMTLVGGFTATSPKAVIDASGMDGTELAKNAVRGAPYSYWLVKGAISGTVTVSELPTMPAGYKVEAQVLAACGVRLIVKAPVEAMFGVVGVNLHNGTALSVEGEHGLYPDVLANWGNLQAKANASTTVSNATFTIGNSASGYGIGTYTDEIYRQYMDDSSTTRTITIGAIPFEKYRVLVYYSTDTANYQFQPLVVNDGTADVYYAGETQLKNESNHTVKGRNATWGHSGPNQNMNAINEGVNLLVTDVYTVNQLTLKFTRSGDPRATPCAIQIVKVGEVADAEEPEPESWANPVTGEEQKFAYAFLGTEDNDWSKTANWRTYAVTNWSGTMSGIAPLVKNSEKWGAAVIDGELVGKVKGEGEGEQWNVTLPDASILEGWELKLALFNGVNVTVGEISKYQNAAWIWVDATSSLAFTKWASSGNSTGPVDYCVAAENGITYNMAFDRGIAVNYHFKDAGSVNYAAGFSSGTHTVKRADFTLAAHGEGTRITRKKLIGFTGSYATVTLASDAVVGVDDPQGAVASATKSEAALTGAETLGTYAFVRQDDGYYLEYIDRAGTPETFASYVVGAWDGFENLSSLTNSADFAYVANLNGAAVNEDGSVTIDKLPLAITGGTWWNNRESGKAIVVAMLVSDYSYDMAPSAAMASFWVNGKGNDYIGWKTGANDASKSFAWYNYTSERAGDNAATTPAPGDGGRYWYFIEYNNNGTFVMGSRLGVSEIEDYVTDRACKDGNRPGQAINIGAKDNGVWPATGMKVYAVRILNAAMDNAKRLALAASNSRYQDLWYSRTTSVEMRGTPVLWVKATEEERAAGQVVITLPNFNGPLEKAIVHAETDDGDELVTYSVVCDDEARTVTATISSKGRDGDGWLRYERTYRGDPKDHYEYSGENNALTLYGSAQSGVAYRFGGSGTFSGTAIDNELSGGATVTWSGDYTANGNTYLGMTDGTLSIATGACVRVPHVRILNSGATANRVTLNVDGTLVVTSTCGSNCYGQRGNYAGILFGHWHGQGTYNINTGGRLLGTNTWLEICYTAEEQALNVKGGELKVRGISANHSNADNKGTVTLTEDGLIELAEGYLGQTIIQNYGYGTIRAYSYDNSTTLTLSQAMTLTDATNGTTFDPAGLAINITGAINGSGKLVVNDSSATPGTVQIDASALQTSNPQTFQTSVRRGTLKYAVGTMTGAVTLEKDGVIDLVADVETNAYAITSGAFTLGEGAGIDNITVNGKALVGVWRLNAAGNGIEKVAEVKPEDTKEIIPATDTNDVKIVTTWTNGEDEVKLDLTSAYTLEKVEGGVKATLNPAGQVEVAGETIQVRPELTETDDAHGVEPLVVGDDVSVGVKTIPGLTYELLRGTVPGTYDEANPAARERATGPRTQLTDENKPADSGFYIIRVTQ